MAMPCGAQFLLAGGIYFLYLSDKWGSRNGRIISGHKV